ncbi:MAG TPA: hypothetical protein VIT22_12140 [Pseudoxanthomonas sp.]
MKRLALFTAVFGLAFSAAAQTPTVGPADPATPQTTSAAATRADANATDNQAAKDELADRTCMKETGSRVIRADRNGRKCAIATGRAYTKEDLDRTGAIDLADALRRLDPAIH